MLRQANGFIAKGIEAVGTAIAESAMQRLALFQREPVPATAYRVNQIFMSRRRERRAQAANMHIHRPLLNENMISPYKIEQLRSRINAFQMRHEKM